MPGIQRFCPSSVLPEECDISGITPQKHPAILSMIRILTKSLQISSSPFLLATKSPKAMDLMNADYSNALWG